MRLREFIEKSKDELRGDLIRAIDLIRDGVDIQEVVALISGASQQLDHDDLLFIQKHFDEKVGYMKSQPHIRKANP